MDYRWLAVPVLLAAALGTALFLNQPKVADVGDLGYINVNGDEYLPEDYITPDEVGIGDTEGADFNYDYDFPATVADCTSRTGSEKDRCLLLYSVMNEDGSGCSAMGDPMLRDDCFQKAASVNGKAGFCENLDLGKQDCYIDVAIANNDASLCDKGRMNLDQCYVAVSAGDMAKCGNSYDRRHCNDAVFYKDSSQCAQLETLDGFCYYTIAKQTGNAQLCAKAKASKDSCYFSIAIATNNAAICGNLSETKDNCIAWVALNTGDAQLCEQAGAERQGCIEDIMSQQ